MKRRLRYGRVFAVIAAAAASVAVIMQIPGRMKPDLARTKQSDSAVTVSDDEPVYVYDEEIAGDPAGPVEYDEYMGSIEPTEPALPVYEGVIDSYFHSAAALYSVSDGGYIYSENINDCVYPASLTKLMTAAVAVKYGDLSRSCTVGSEQWLVYEGSSMAYIMQGDTLSLYDLITGMLMASGNDAAYTIAVNVARDCSGNPDMTDYEAVEYFCGLMNQTAAELGMTSSHFTTPDGWDCEGQYTTVSDLVTLSTFLMNYPEIMQITGTFQKTVVSQTGQCYTWTNSNLLLDPYYDLYRGNVFGMKTGTTLCAGNCLVSAFYQNGKTYISAVTGCYSDYDRYALTLELMGLANS